MDLRVSYNWLREYVETPLAPEEFARRVSLCGPSIERVEHRAQAFNHMAVGRVEAMRKHPNADKLRVVRVNLGKESRELVCGGTNLREGMLVAVALPGARVRWHGEGEPVTLEEAEIRGVRSAGMICAANEIGLGEMFPAKSPHEIVDLSALGAKPGALLARALGLDDAILSVEVTGNRPDAFSMVGLAREASAILPARFLWKERALPRPPKGGTLSVRVTAPKLCSRYEAALVRNVAVTASPARVRECLQSSGARAINNLVDITNYVMLELGQPMHAFDAQKIKGGITVRLARGGESIAALDGVKYTLTPEMLVIADAEKPIAIAGVIGGAESAVGSGTREVIFEAATFDPVSVRRTARALGIQTDSSLRFEKGLSPESAVPALARALELAKELAGGDLVALASVRAKARRSRFVSVSEDEVARLIGIPIALPRMKKILASLGFAPVLRGKTLRARVPVGREIDIESGRDLVEEIARVYGYHNLPATLPSGEIPLRPRDPEFVWEEKLREWFFAAGLTEVVSYSLVGKQQLAHVGVSPDEPLRLANPLSTDLEYLRTELLSSLLSVVAENQGHAHQGALFEIAHVYLPRATDLPEEVPRALAVLWSDEVNDKLFLAAKGLAEGLLARSEVVNCELAAPTTPSPLLHPARQLGFFVGARQVGCLGEVHPRLTHTFGIEHRVAVLDLDVRALVSQAQTRRTYSPIPQYPSGKRDVAFIVAERVTYAEIYKTLRASEPLLASLELFDIYSGKGVPDGKKSVAFHLEYRLPVRTLTSEEVDAAHERVLAALRDKLAATIRV